jgi:hypothetical protein
MNWNTTKLIHALVMMKLKCALNVGVSRLCQTTNELSVCSEINIYACLQHILVTEEDEGARATSSRLQDLQ